MKGDLGNTILCVLMCVCVYTCICKLEAISHPLAAKCNLVKSLIRTRADTVRLPSTYLTSARLEEVVCEVSSLAPIPFCKTILAMGNQSV